MSVTGLRIEAYERQEARNRRQEMAERARAIRDLIDRAYRLAETLDEAPHRDGLLSDLSDADFEASLYAEEMSRGT